MDILPSAQPVIRTSIYASSLTVYQAVKCGKRKKERKGEKRREKSFCQAILTDKT